MLLQQRCRCSFVRSLALTRVSRLPAAWQRQAAHGLVPQDRSHSTVVLLWCRIAGEFVCLFFLVRLEPRPEERAITRRRLRLVL